ncbi:MAG: glycosyltransferase [Anaeromyxobacteraceae bacterium]
MRLRIAEVINSFDVGGGEVQLLELVRGLQGAHQLGVHALEVRGTLLPRLRALGVEPSGHPLGGSLASRAALRQVRALASAFRAQRAEVVHAHDFYSAAVAIPAARLAGARSVIGRLDLGHLQGPAQRVLLAALTHAADAAVANCDAIRDAVVAEGVPRRRIAVIRNGIDLARFDARAAAPPEGPLPGRPGAPIVVLVANMRHEVKRQEDFLEALALARRERPDLEAWLVGEGSREPELKRRAALLGVSGAAHFLGGRVDVPALLRRATIGALASAREGLSNAIIEKMAAGLPLVVTRAGGNPELVEHGERGLVVPVRRPDAMARALVRLAGDPDRARAMGRAARRYVEASLSIERLVAEHEALYARLATSSSSARPASAGGRSGGGWARKAATILPR